MKVSFYLTRGKAKGQTAIYARISYSGHQLKYYTPEAINPSYWNKQTKLAKQTERFKEYPEFNQRLVNWKSDVGNIFRTWVNNHGGMMPNPTTLKELLDRELKKEEPEKEMEKTFFGFFEHVIHQTEAGVRLQPASGKPYSKATLQVYKNTLNRLRAFEAHTGHKIDFKSITVDFYTEFTGYLAKRLKLAANTIGKDVKTLKTVLNEATERGLNDNLQYKSRKFSVTSEAADSIYLTTEELSQLESLDLSHNSRLANIRDLFLVGSYTGLRFSDWATLTPDKIKDGFFEVTQAKTGPR